MAKVEKDGKQKCREILVTTKKTNTLLGLDKIENLGPRLHAGKTDPETNYVEKIRT